jgi:hypothetical protein
MESLLSQRQDQVRVRRQPDGNKTSPFVIPAILSTLRTHGPGNVQIPFRVKAVSPHAPL